MTLFFHDITQAKYIKCSRKLEIRRKDVKVNPQIGDGLVKLITEKLYCMKL